MIRTAPTLSPAEALADQQFVRLCDCGCGQPTRIWTRSQPHRGRIKGQPASLVGSHRRNKPARLRVTDDMWTVEENGCWRAFSRPNDAGYCYVKVGGRRRSVHIAVYEHFNGPVPSGLQLDHLCRNRWCCNPDHLEPVTQAENIRRGVKAKLTADDVAAIRASSDRRADLAEHYGVSLSCIKKARSGATWATGVAS